MRRPSLGAALLAALLLPPGASPSAAPAPRRDAAPPPVSVPLPAPDAVERARSLFERYVSLERAFDPAAADLYSDRALIRSRRVSPTGEERVVTLPAPQYKEILRKAIPLARSRGDAATYGGTRFLPEGERVRIVTTRFPAPGREGTPLSLLVGPGEDGEWRILEELTVSRPPGPKVPPAPGGAEISPLPHTTR